MLALLLATAEPLLLLSDPVATMHTAQATDSDDEQICAQLSAVAEKFIAQTPTMVDAVTRVDGLAVICAARMVTTSKYILLNLSEMKDGWQETKQAQLNAQDCNIPSTRALIDRGWTFQQVFAFRSGERFVLKARCQ